MKAIIDKRRYDTETAKFVAKYSNGLGPSDFKSVDEALYLTENGSWFIAGEGGAMTSYSQPVGDMTGGGSEIRPRTADQALSWLEMHDEHKKIEKYFSAQIEDA